MRQSKCEVYLHFVWGTLGREAFVTADIERAVYRCIEKEAKRLKCEVLAIGGMPDHVHLCVKLPSTLTISRLMNQVKGVASHFVRSQQPGDLPFRWQEGYGVFSVSPNQVRRIGAYVKDQKQHHRDGSLQTRWEETDEEYRPHL